MLLLIQNQSQGGMFQPLQDAIGLFLSYIPQLIGALIILIIGYVIAKLLQAVIGRVLQGIGFDRWMERGGIKQFFDRAETNQTPASILGALVFWFVFIIAITMAADALGIPQVSAVLAQLISYIPNIIAAILILILAALLANFLAGIVRGATGSEMLSSVARYAIIVYAVFAALTQLGIAVQLTANTFLIVLGAVALAGAIAFGIGGREVARDILEKAYNRTDEVQGGSTQGTSARSTAAGGRGRDSDPSVHRLDRNE
jgi:small-conductance mechanosensitive channel